MTTFFYEIFKTTDVDAIELEKVAECKYAEDAAAVVALYSAGSQIRVRDIVLWDEGINGDGFAGDSYDRVRQVVMERFDRLVNGKDQAEPKPKPKPNLSPCMTTLPKFVSQSAARAQSHPQSSPDVRAKTDGHPCLQTYTVCARWGN